MTGRTTRRAAVKIGEMARRAGVSPKAVRRYEQLGLLTPRRKPNGYRDFDEDDIRIARELRSLRELGITAERTRPFLECLASGAADSDECPSSLAEYAAAIDELTARITELADRRAMLLRRLKEAAYRNSVARPATTPPGHGAPSDNSRAEPAGHLDHGALDYLTGRRLPGVALHATSGETIRIDDLGPGRTVLYLYPLTGRPDRDLPEGWKTIPGASGCTPQACGFRDHHQQLLDAGAAKVHGLSSQDSDYQRELVERLRLPFAMLSDPGFALASALDLPTFQAADMRLYRRVTLIVRNQAIEHVFHPVSEPGRHAEQVLAWLRSR
jgi:peroxiredoxin/DNA-binding transcriptional MerR regulator